MLEEGGGWKIAWTTPPKSKLTFSPGRGPRVWRSKHSLGSYVRGTDAHNTWTYTEKTLEVASGLWTLDSSGIGVMGMTSQQHIPGRSVRGKHILIHTLRLGTEVRGKLMHQGYRHTPQCIDIHTQNSRSSARDVNIGSHNKRGSVCRDDTEPSGCEIPYSPKPYIRASYSGVRLVV